MSESSPAEMNAVKAEAASDPAPPVSALESLRELLEFVLLEPLVVTGGASLVPHEKSVLHFAPQSPSVFLSFLMQASTHFVNPS